MVGFAAFNFKPAERSRSGGQLGSGPLHVAKPHRSATVGSRAVGDHISPRFHVEFQLAGAAVPAEIPLISGNGYDRTRLFAAPFERLAALPPLVLDGEIAVPDGAASPISTR